MKLIAPITITDAMLLSSNVPEDDAAVWSAGTTYALDALVMVLSVHRIYKSAVAGNIGNDPVTDDGTKWIELEATNRWKAFDHKLGDVVTSTGSIIYEIATGANFVSGIGFLSVGAATILIEVFDATDVLLYTNEVNRYDSTSIVDWYTFFTTDLELEDVADTIFDNISGYPGNRIKLTLLAETPESVVTVGQVVLGVSYELGLTMAGTTIGIKDYSSKDRDDFGNAVITERAFADTVHFNFMLDPKNARRVRNILSRQRAVPTLFYAAANLSNYGMQAYGFYQDFDIPLTNHDVCYASLRVEGLV